MTLGPISSAPEPSTLMDPFKRAFIEIPYSTLMDPVCRIEVGAVTQSAFATASVDQPASCLGLGNSGEWSGALPASELLKKGTNRGEMGRLS